MDFRDLATGTPHDPSDQPVYLRAAGVPCVDHGSSFGRGRVISLAACLGPTDAVRAGSSLVVQDPPPTVVRDRPDRLRRPRIGLVTEFSGMDAPSMALSNLDVDFDLLSMSESRRAAREFVIQNFKPIEARERAEDEPDLRGRPADLYLAGFPCQPFSLLGLRGGVDDAHGRGDGGDLCIRRIQQLQPRGFVLENVPGLTSIHGGSYFRRLIAELTGAGYAVDFDILDSQDYGLPQRRRRLYIVGRRGVWAEAFAFPAKRPRVSLRPFLDAKEKDEDPERLPAAGLARDNAATALRQSRQDRTVTNGADLVVDIDCSGPRLRPASSVVPCLTASRTQGLWLLSRGRRMRPREALRCQGVSPAKYAWNVSSSEMFRLAGNAVSVPVVEAVLQRLLEDLRLLEAEPGVQERPREDGGSVVARGTPPQEVTSPKVGTSSLAGRARPLAAAQVPRTLRATRRGVRGQFRPWRSSASRPDMMLVDIFGAGGGVAAQVEAQGFPAARWGAKYGEQYDVRRAGPRRELLRVIREGKVFGALLTPDWKAGASDESTVRAVVDIVGELDRVGVPWILAAASCADEWQQLDVIDLSLLHRVRLLDGDLCAHGGRARARTRFLCGRLDEQDCESLGVTCRGTGGLCCFAQRRHARPSLAQRWPVALRRRVAGVFLANERAAHAASAFDF